MQFSSKCKNREMKHTKRNSNNSWLFKESTKAKTTLTTLRRSEEGGGGGSSRRRRQGRYRSNGALISSRFAYWLLISFSFFSSYFPLSFMVFIFQYGPENLRSQPVFVQRMFNFGPCIEMLITARKNESLIPFHQITHWSI